MSGASHRKEDRMQEKKLIGYAVVAIIAYYVLAAVLPFLIWGVIGWLLWKAYQEYQRLKK
jgi:hypothetical protein